MKRISYRNISEAGGKEATSSQHEDFLLSRDGTKTITKIEVEANTEIPVVENVQIPTVPITASQLSSVSATYNPSSSFVSVPQPMATIPSKKSMSNGKIFGIFFTLIAFAALLGMILGMGYNEGWFALDFGNSVIANDNNGEYASENDVYEEENYLTGVIVRDANVRSGNSTRNSVVGTVSGGTEVTITGPNERGWYPIRSGELSGWVWEELITVQSES